VAKIKRKIPIKLQQYLLGTILILKRTLKWGKGKKRKKKKGIKHWRKGNLGDRGTKKDPQVVPNKGWVKKCNLLGPGRRVWVPVITGKRERRKKKTKTKNKRRSDSSWENGPGTKTERREVKKQTTRQKIEKLREKGSRLEKFDRDGGYQKKKAKKKSGDTTFKKEQKKGEDQLRKLTGKGGRGLGRVRLKRKRKERLVMEAGEGEGEVDTQRPPPLGTRGRRGENRGKGKGYRELVSGGECPQVKTTGVEKGGGGKGIATGEGRGARSSCRKEKKFANRRKVQRMGGGRKTCYEKKKTQKKRGGTKGHGDYQGRGGREKPLERKSFPKKNS